MNRSQTFLNQSLCEVLTVNVQSTNEATDLVAVFDVNLDVALLTAAVGKLMCLFAKRFALFAFISR